MAGKVRWPALAINPSQELESGITSIEGALSQLGAAVSSVQGQVSALQGEAAGHVLKAGDTMTGLLDATHGRVLIRHDTSTAGLAGHLDLLGRQARGRGVLMRASDASQEWFAGVPYNNGAASDQWGVGRSVGGTAEDIDEMTFRVRQGVLEGNDQAGSGWVEVFPAGTLITMGYGESATDITNVSATEAEQAVTVQTIACDYANQAVWVEVTVFAVWKGYVASDFYYIRPSVNGTAQGINFSEEFDVTSTDATAGGDNIDIDGTTAATDPGDTNSGGNNTNTSAASDVAGVSGTASSHSHTSGSYAAAGHTHTITSHTHTMGTHTHASGSLTVNGTHTHSHNHAMLPSRTFQTRTWRGQVTADGSGNVTVGISARSEGGTMDIDGWSLSYAVWRR